MRWIHEIPRVRARQDGAATALVQDATRWTYAAWDAAIDASAEQLASLGAGAGDRIAIVGENGLVVATGIHAASRLGAWPMVLNARLSAFELETILAHAEPRIVLFAGDVSAEARAHAGRLAARPARWGALLELAVLVRDGATRETVAGDPARDVAALIYTSGTTGAPKGVMLTHRNLLHVARWSGAWRGLTATDRVLGVLPISHVFGLASVFLASTLAGASLHLLPRFDPAATLALAERERLTVFQGVPAMFARLLEHVKQRGAAPSLTALRYASAGGSVLDLGLKRAAEAMLGVKLNNGYGMTELAPTVSTTRIDEPRDDDSVGRALPELELRIVDDAGAVLPPGTTGRLLVRGPTVMRGYYRSPAQTAAVIDAEGFLDTGDLACIGADGALFIRGRAKDLIIRSGFNVHPEEVEAVLLAHPDVTLAAAVGRATGDGNEDVIAFVQLAPAARATPAELAAWCAARLAPYKRPARIEAMAQLPASSTGKIRKTDLRALAARLP